MKYHIVMLLHIFVVSKIVLRICNVYITKQYYILRKKFVEISYYKTQILNERQYLSKIQINKGLTIVISIWFSNKNY